MDEAETLRQQLGDMTHRYGQEKARRVRLEEEMLLLKGRRDEVHCARCKGRNIVWYAPDYLWRRVEFAFGFRNLCPICFALLAERLDLVRLPVWRVLPESSWHLRLLQWPRVWWRRLVGPKVADAR